MKRLKQDLLGLVPGRYPLASVKDAFFIIQQFRPKCSPRPVRNRTSGLSTSNIFYPGAERIGMAQADANDKPIEERWAKDDVAFFAAPPDETFIDLAPGRVCHILSERNPSTELLYRANRFPFAKQLSKFLLKLFSHNFHRFFVEYTPHAPREGAPCR